MKISVFRAESMSAPCGWFTFNYPATRHDLCLGLPQVFLHILRLRSPAEYFAGGTHIRNRETP